MRVASMHTRRGAEAVLAFRGQRELVADPGDGGAHGALVAGLAFDPEIPLPAFAGVQPLDHRAHEGEVADVQLALARSACRRRGFISDPKPGKLPRVLRCASFELVAHQRRPSSFSA